MRIAISAFLLACLIAVPCKAGWWHVSWLRGYQCPNCGCCALKKVCRPTEDKKKVPEVKFEVEEEDVCLAGKSRCEEVEVCDPECPGGVRCETVQVATAERIITKKKLKKITNNVDKPTCKFVVEYECCQCGMRCVKPTADDKSKTAKPATTPTPAPATPPATKPSGKTPEAKPRENENPGPARELNQEKRREDD